MVEKIQHYSWEQIEEMCETLSQKVEKPDVIIGMSRGGLPIAMILSDILNLDRIYAMGVKRYKGNMCSEIPTIYQDISPETVSGKKILIVDDLLDTGRNMKHAMEHIKAQGAKEVKCFAIFKKPWSEITPDFYQKETDSWIIFPWDKREMQREMKLAENKA